MSDEVLFGRIKGPRAAIEGIVIDAAIGTKTSEPSGGADKQSIPFYRVYFGITDGMLSTLGTLKDQSVASYNTVFDEKLDTIEVGGEIKQRAQEQDTEPVCEAVFKYYKFMEKLDLVCYDEDVTVSFLGQPGAEYATEIRIESDLEVQYTVSSSSTAKNEIPKRLLSSFDDNNVFTQTQNPMEVEIDTSVSEMQKIINVIENDDELLYYPISSEGNNLTLEAEGSMGRSSVHGSLPKSTVDNPGDEDLDNKYHNGFKEVFSVLDGSVTLYTHPPAGDGTRGGPLQILQEDGSMIRRYILAPTKKS